jgi:dynein assembly factor 1, axonemal
MGDGRRSCSQATQHKILNGNSRLKECTHRQVQQALHSSSANRSSLRMTEMTVKVLKDLCKEHKLYTTPSINDKLYLHYRGFHSIQNLEAYTGLKALWLEGNGFSRIEGLNHLIQLRTLYLHENIIEKIEGLDQLVELDSLNLSKNFIKKVENISSLKKLTSLNLANNHLTTAADIVEVLELPALQTLDLQHNHLQDTAIVDIVSQIKDLRVLYLQGNPVVKDIRHYRKVIIGRCPQLKYLDDRPGKKRRPYSLSLSLSV